MLPRQQFSPQVGDPLTCGICFVSQDKHAEACWGKEAEFVLVNETRAILQGPIKPHEVVLKREHTRDQLIRMIGDAYPEFTDLVKELDHVKKDYLGACQTVAAMHEGATGRKGKGPIKGVVEDCEEVGSRYRKALDIIRTIAYGQHNGDQARFICNKFMDDAKRLGQEENRQDNVVPLVNENPTPDAPSDQA